VSKGEATRLNRTLELEAPSRRRKPEGGARRVIVCR
jgi:hypothetical protein